ncbi:Non-structural maintenance of chromosome element 4 [Hondaea fermentalgiana]|uniref:Non-structural maintenance of chromosomes element 4 n=1 Tax=Hondaea fermentalgiana TaxID=2315210 RepID=A0A2R5G669_9STRA|nr:Non-structural maintenance of chromosome element 4 [Hondaea fermentalgiana]|eukprot:GBG23933.1 Non-structural maintenance of chromosome element 4 [Hondaea fermentalgiana]
MSSNAEAKARRRREKALIARKVIDDVGATFKTANLKRLEGKEDVKIVSTALNTLDDNLGKIKETNLAKADAEVFADLGQKSAQTIKDAARSTRRIEEGDLINSLQRKHKIEDSNILQWDTLGETANMYFNGIFDNGFFLNALDVVPRERKARQKRQKLTEAPIERPEKVVEEKDKASHRAQAHHEILQKQIAGIVKANQKTGFLETVVNPESFTQTVENVFSSSFLMNNNECVMQLGANGEPELAVSSNDDTRAPQQSILSFTMKDWQDAVEVYNIKKSALPTRKDPIYANTF